MFSNTFYNILGSEKSNGSISISNINSLDVYSIEAANQELSKFDFGTYEIINAENAIFSNFSISKLNGQITFLNANIKNISLGNSENKSGSISFSLVFEQIAPITNTSYNNDSVTINSSENLVASFFIDVLSNSNSNISFDDDSALNNSIVITEDSTDNSLIDTSSGYLDLSNSTIAESQIKYAEGSSIFSFANNSKNIYIDNNKTDGYSIIAKKGSLKEDSKQILDFAVEGKTHIFKEYSNTDKINLINNDINSSGIYFQKNEDVIYIYTPHLKEIETTSV